MILIKMYNQLRWKERADKFRPPEIYSKSISTLCVISFIVSIGIFCYTLAGIEGKIGWSGKETYTISEALEEGNKAGFVTFASIAFILLLLLICVREGRYLPFRMSLLVFSFGLLLSLPWVTVGKNKTVHYTLASFIFVSIFIFIVLNYYLLWKQFKSEKINLIIFSILVTFFTISMVVFASLGGDTGTDIFAIFEILFTLSFLLCIIILGWY